MHITYQKRRYRQRDKETRGCTQDNKASVRKDKREGSKGTGQRKSQNI